MTYPATPALLVLSALSLSACIPSIVVGDSPQDETTDSTPPGSTTAPDLPTGDPTDGGTASGGPTEATGDPPAPGVCGDGVVDPGQACDDGNDEPHDGCDAACTRTGAIVWTVERPGDLVGFAVAADGTSYASGYDPGSFLAAFAPDGSELWKIAAQGAGPLAVDADGRIYLLSEFSGVLAFAPDGATLWHIDPDAEQMTFPPLGIDAGSDGLYVANYEAGAQERAVVRRLDLASGQIVWESVTPEGEDVEAHDLAVVGDRVFVVGRTTSDVEILRPMLATFDTAGALLSLKRDDPTDSGRWYAVDGVGDGDLVLAGLDEEHQPVVRRLRPDQSEAWLHPAADVSPMIPERVIAGPGERIAVVGSDLSGGGIGVVGLHDGDGALLWSSKFDVPQEDVNEQPVGVGFGPELLLAGGSIWTVHANNNITTTWWIRGFALD